mmetsp:Transcript_9877/g.16170  ORF Transcript_9877/g.16170 Transcript_9877/m.16170 type:complete len:418 (+) Transcript_9877:211-1464(+)
MLLLVLTICPGAILTLPRRLCVIGIPLTQLLMLSVNNIIINPLAVIDINIKILHILPINRQRRQARHGTSKGGFRMRRERKVPSQSAESAHAPNGHSSSERHAHGGSCASLGGGTAFTAAVVGIVPSSSSHGGTVLNGLLIRHVSIVIRLGGIVLIHGVGILRLRCLVLLMFGRGSRSNTTAVAVRVAEAMDASGAGHASLFATARDYCGEEVFRLVENIDDAWAHLGVPRTVLPQNIVIWTTTIIVPIKPHHRTHTRNSTLQNGIHIRQGHIPRHIHALRLGSIPHHAQIPRRLVRNPSTIGNILHLDQYHAQLHVGRRVEQSVDGGSTPVTSLQNGFDDLDTMRTGDAFNGHAELHILPSSIPIGRHRHNGSHIRIAILGRIDIVQLPRQLVHPRRTSGNPPMGQLVGGRAHLLD